MKTRRTFALAGSVLLVATVGCNKEPNGNAAAASTTSQAAAAPSSQTAPGMMGPGMQNGQGMPGANGPGTMQGNSGQAGSGMNGPMILGTNGGMMDQMRAGCPMVIPDADVGVAETGGGVALTFTTQKGDVNDLQARVEHMAQMYGMMHQGSGSMMWHQMGNGHGGMGMGNGPMGNGSGMGNSMGMMGNGGGMGMGDDSGHMGAGGPMPAAKTTVEKTAKGARLVLTPTDASQLAALWQHVRFHQQRMQSGQCWMLQDQPGASAGAPPPAK